MTVKLFWSLFTLFSVWTCGCWLFSLFPCHMEPKLHRYILLVQCLLFVKKHELQLYLQRNHLDSEIDIYFTKIILVKYPGACRDKTVIPGISMHVDEPVTWGVTSSSRSHIDTAGHAQTGSPHMSANIRANCQVGIILINQTCSQKLINLLMSYLKLTMLNSPV